MPSSPTDRSLIPTTIGLYRIEPGGGNSPQFHHLERCATHEAVGIAHRLLGLVVIIASAHDEARWFAGAHKRRMEFARLALEFGCLERAIGQRQWRADAVEMALRAELLLHAIGE